MDTYADHLVVCGYDPVARRLLRGLIDEVGTAFAGRFLVLAPGPQPDDLPDEIAWVDGESTRERELQRVGIADAAIVVIVGSRSVSPQEADATTILTAFTVRSVLQRAEDELNERPRPYMIAEILDSENVEHARTAGCDEIVETLRLGFSLLAHAVTTPGSASIVTEIAARGGQNLHVGIAVLPDGPLRFSQLAGRLKRDEGILLVGVRGSAGRHEVNPPSDRLVVDGEELFYFASRPILPRRA